MRVALIQQKSFNDPILNLKRAKELISQANEADIVVLPEAFLFPNGHGLENFSKDIDLVSEFSNLAKENNIILVAGTLPEYEGDKIYNTCYVFSQEGEILTKYRKIHLFDVTIPGVQSRESERYNSGDSLALFESPFGTIGLAVCFDLRFPELFIKYAQEGANIIIVPAAFTEKTGKVHWELLNCARALDSQSYIISCNMAKNEEADFVTYGHSCITSPNGTVILQVDEDEQIVYCNLNTDDVEAYRKVLPVLNRRRPEVYK